MTDLEDYENLELEYQHIIYPFIDEIKNYILETKEKLDLNYIDRACMKCVSLCKFDEYSNYI